MALSAEARKLLREFNRELERERHWKAVKAFVAEWYWLPIVILGAWILWLAK